MVSATSACTVCVNLQDRKHVVVGVGPEHPRLTFIGEAPGATEDETGLPFVGQAGSILNRCLDEAKVPRDQVYITNIVKCRPPQNRTPTPQEIACCDTYLRYEIASTAPSSIVLLGNTALSSFFPGTPLTPNIGKRLTHTSYPNRFFVPAYHPAMVLYRPNMLQRYIYDMSGIIRREALDPK